MTLIPRSSRCCTCWSLGVEEQFYLTWPLIIAYLYKSTRHLPGVICGLLIASFVINVVLVYGLFHGSASLAFYWPITRFWELLMGALLAYLVILRSPGIELRRPWLEASAWVGLLLLVAGYFSSPRSARFRAGWASLPTVGTLLLIAARDSWVSRRLLSNRALVFVGLISYPLYLWHWLLLAIAGTRLDMDGAEAPRLECIAIIAGSFALAWLELMRDVEKPIRFASTRYCGRSPCSGSWWALRASGWSSMRAMVQHFGIRKTFDLWRCSNTETQRDHSEVIYRAGKCLLYAAQSFADIAPECTDAPDGHKPLLVLWGDPHAAALYPGLKALQAHAEISESPNSPTAHVHRSSASCCSTATTAKNSTMMR